MTIHISNVGAASVRAEWEEDPTNLENKLEMGFLYGVQIQLSKAVNDSFDIPLKKIKMAMIDSIVNHFNNPNLPLIFSQEYYHFATICKNSIAHKLHRELIPTQPSFKKESWNR
ncbi:hypothetical protein Glove_130g52 [Diversispora epigaea]|uniref:Uncharacterized protein n=1 Tax=Diversispora epigaea TaxID=1348612 RepID=A0A397J893_9GLOM|nr:hypothetical protein Glove_130g52 [Diversispora epigaea]